MKTDFQNIIHQTRYARWLPEEKRRETWQETVEGYLGYISVRSTVMGYRINERLYQRIIEFIYNLYPYKVNTKTGDHNQ